MTGRQHRRQAAEGCVEHVHDGLAAGVDGCNAGWVLVVALPGGSTRVEVITVGFERIAKRRDLGLVVVDIPIGLPDKGPRQADKAARRLLGKRGCCVFPAPVRPLLHCVGWEEISAKRRDVEGKGATKQMAAIIPKIREADSIVDHRLQAKIREGHPEVSFAAMNDGIAIQSKKKKLAGRNERLALLRGYFSDVDARVEEYPAYKEDIIDAYAMLWTAQRLKRRSAKRLPADVIEIDPRKLHMEINY